MEKESNMFNDLNCSFLRPNWENSMDQNDPFESALSSMVSSPTASNANNNNNNRGENIVLRELIGRLGSICNSGEISPFNGNNNNNSANTSCYSTPLNSPPNLNLSSSMSMMRERERERERGGVQNYFASLPTLAPFSADPAFADRAARFSCFAISAPDPAKIPRVSRNKIPGSTHPSTTVQENWEKATAATAAAALHPAPDENTDSRENSTLSEQINANANVNANHRKRKSAPKGKAKETPKDSDVVAAAAAASDDSESSEKRSKSENEKANHKTPAEPPKDYIHVRARRGQATDAHSLAERVRREKISERMKMLQDLVPGCNKVTGKAVMLDEIINYVQSLQRQVEFLSMKLATVNPRMDFNMEALMSKDMFQSRGNTYPSDSYPFPAHNPTANAAAGRNQSIQLGPMENFGDQVSSFWEDDLHSIVQMGFGTQNFQEIAAAQMKVEL